MRSTGCTGRLRGTLVLVGVGSSRVGSGRVGSDRIGLGRIGSGKHRVAQKLPPCVGLGLCRSTGLVLGLTLDGTGRIEWFWSLSPISG